MGRKNSFIDGFEKAGSLKDLVFRPIETSKALKKTTRYGLSRLAGGALIGAGALGYAAHKANESTPKLTRTHQIGDIGPQY